MTFYRFGTAILSLAFITAIWWVIAVSGFVNRTFLPTPVEVWAAAAEMAQSGVLLNDTLVSLGRSAIGFAIGVALGVSTGLLTARLPLFDAALSPFLTLLRPIPSIALVPVAIVWFGIGEGSKYFVISFTVFLTVWLSTHHGMTMVGETWIRAARSLGASRRREFLEVVIPAAAPHIMAGLRIAAALAFLSLVAAELTGATSGIGYRLQEARQYIRVDRMFVCLIQLGLLGAALDLAILALGRRIIHWEQT